MVTTLVIADHGNCETMINPDGSPNTYYESRTIYFSWQWSNQIHDGVLGTSHLPFRINGHRKTESHDRKFVVISKMNDIILKTRDKICFSFFYK
jgi:hypothetical protein